MIKYHVMAIIIGFFLDLIIGDPYCLPHPIRLIGKMIGYLEIKLIGPKKEFKYNTRYEDSSRKKRKKGTCLVIFVLGMTGGISAGILVFSYWIHPLVGLIVESIMTCQILATKSLKVESMKVYCELKKGNLAAARNAVSMIVGRDTENLQKISIAKAAIETVAENTSDGVIAPMVYTMIGGPILGFLYKAVNTMDSIVGYKTERYLDFGRTAAKLDDLVNYIPARISALLLIISSGLCQWKTKLISKHADEKEQDKYNMKRAWQIYRRDRYHHASPNSAHTEAALAGALGIQLAGDASYFGKTVKKPYIGDAIRPVEIEDIKRVNRLMYVAAFLCEGCSILIIGGIYLWMR